MPMATADSHYGNTTQPIFGHASMEFSGYFSSEAPTFVNDRWNLQFLFSVVAAMESNKTVPSNSVGCPLYRLIAPTIK
jgi:hypothetical protein